MRSQSLAKIGARYRTDKQTAHEYLQFYDSLFYTFRYRSLRMLEIGFFKGASAKLFAEYFPSGLIHVMDHKAEKATEYWKSFPEDLQKRIIIHQGDQGSRADLQAVLDEVNGGTKKRSRQFGVIIDDGSHRPDHQITSFEELWPAVEPGGYYIIEDLHVAYVREGKTWKHETVDYFIDKLHHVNKNAGREERKLIDIDSISFARNLIVIKKKEGVA